MAEDLRVTAGLVIPAAELGETASRAGGPGGQHVNKASTRVTLRWSVRESRALDEATRQRLLRRLGPGLTRGGELLVHAQATRSRARNRELARQRLAERVRAALAPRRPRRPTRPGAGARARRLEAKRRTAEKKRRRGRVPPDEA